MNKKLMTIAGAIALGSLMLGASAYAAVSGTSGYDIYKQAFKNTYAVSSMTPKTEVVVKDNGNLLFKVDAITKYDKTNEAMSNSVTVASGDQTKTVDIFNQDHKTIIKNSDSNVYNVLEKGKERPGHKEVEKDDPSRIKDIENVVDALAGNVQNYITSSSNADGTQEVSLKLSGNQVSPVANAVASLAVKNLGREKGFGEHKGRMDSVIDTSLKDKLPKLVDNIRVSNVDVDATISKDNLIQNQTENIIISGTDANGQAHEIVVSVNTSFSGFNNTKPDTVDLTGKQVNTITHQKKFEQE